MYIYIFGTHLPATRFKNQLKTQIEIVRLKNVRSTHIPHFFHSFLSYWFFAVYIVSRKSKREAEKTIYEIKKKRKKKNVRTIIHVNIQRIFWYKHTNKQTDRHRHRPIHCIEYTLHERIHACMVFQSLIKWQHTHAYRYNMCAIIARAREQQQQLQQQQHQQRCKVKRKNEKKSAKTTTKQHTESKHNIIYGAHSGELRDLCDADEFSVQFNFVSLKSKTSWGFRPAIAATMSEQEKENALNCIAAHIWTLMDSKMACIFFG